MESHSVQPASPITCYNLGENVTNFHGKKKKKVHYFLVSRPTHSKKCGKNCWSLTRNFHLPYERFYPSRRIAAGRLSAAGCWDAFSVSCTVPGRTRQWRWVWWTSAKCYGTSKIWCESKLCPNSSKHLVLFISVKSEGENWDLIRNDEHVRVCVMGEVLPWGRYPCSAATPPATERAARCLAPTVPASFYHKCKASNGCHPGRSWAFPRAEA